MRVHLDTRAVPTDLDDDGLSHIACRCDKDRALCGKDLCDAHDCPEDLSCGCLYCVVCVDLEDVDCPRCGW